MSSGASDRGGPAGDMGVSGEGLAGFLAAPFEAARAAAALSKSAAVADLPIESSLGAAAAAFGAGTDRVNGGGTFAGGSVGFAGAAGVSVSGPGFVGASGAMASGCCLAIHACTRSIVAWLT